MLKLKKKSKVDLIIFLTDFTAEGCPILALNLIDEFKKKQLSILVVRFYNKNNELLDKFISRKITTKSMNLDKGFIRYLQIIFFTYSICLKYKPKSILTFPFGWHSFIAIGAKLAGIGTICAHAGNPAPKLRNIKSLKFFIIVSLGRFFTTKIICCSKYIRETLIKRLFLLQKETTFIYNSFDEDRFKINKKNKKLENQFKKEIKIGMVARLEIHKDQETLIKAISILKKKNYKIKLLIIGDGTKKLHLKKLVEKLNITEEVSFLGAKNDVEIILEKLDIFAFSTTQDEGFGIALAEAMAKGVPIIASDVEACREILLNGKCGLLVKPYSPKEFVSGIERILINEEETYIRKEKAYKYALDNFTKAIMANNYIYQLKLKN